eukprot:TRINITY_DN1555_c0_g1_i1.p1 TRINITY_DN1555_c0_g1~~TRINITY_DN1555_c0_g1_i1.p1  ORF type:complete len:316 (+),score=77.06 TRINITY_DN1555_c0_g1_i1:96-1043(+)
MSLGASSAGLDMDALKVNDQFRPGGLFDEFLQLQPAQLSWGGMVSVVGNLIQSHGACLTRLGNLEASIQDMSAALESRVSPMKAPLPGGNDSAAAADVDKLYSVLQLDKPSLDSALHQAEIEGASSHSKVKLLHSLPAFSTLIEDIRDVLVPLSAAPLPADDVVAPESTYSRGAPTPPSSHTHTHAAKHSTGFSGSRTDTRDPSPAGRPMAGLEIIDSIPGSADPLASSGVRVLAVRPDGPAAMGGVRNGDCIVALNDQPVQTRSDLKAVMSACRPNDLVHVELLREGVADSFSVHIRLGLAPGSATPTHSRPVA